MLASLRSSSSSSPGQVNAAHYLPPAHSSVPVLFLQKRTNISTEIYLNPLSVEGAAFAVEDLVFDNPEGLVGAHFEAEFIFAAPLAAQAGESFRKV